MLLYTHAISREGGREGKRTHIICTFDKIAVDYWIYIISK